MPPKKMQCEVRGCEKRSKGIDANSLTLHRFPLEVTEAEQWSRFSGSAHALDQFQQFGSVGVRKLWMCSQHFEPHCYKAMGSKANLRYGVVPTLNGPSDEPEEDDTTAPNETVGGDCDAEGGKKKTATVSEEGRDSSDAGTEPQQSAAKRKKTYLDDPFFDFLKDNDGDSSGSEQPLVQQIPSKPPADKPSSTVPSKPKIRRTHAPFCVCNICRTNRAAKAMGQGFSPNKAIQTIDSGPQPDASPVPVGTSQDSCRLCFSNEQLEPLCSGMIVVRDEMLDKIYVCTGILIIPRPKVSMFICTPCAQLINSFHAYRQQVCSNNRALLKTIELKASATTKAAPKIQKVSPLPPSTTPLVKPVLKPVVIKRKPPVGLAPVIDVFSSPSPAQFRKIAPKIPMVVQPEIQVNTPIKDEADDPLEGCGRMTPIPSVVMSPVARKSNILINFQPKPIATTSKPLAVPTQLYMEAEEGQEGLPEGERWKCWHCENSFPFQFECAKHLLQVHEENVGSIKRRLNLDELNANMLQMMSMNQKK
ncbi:uncharacterized protein LOC134202296 [Armigeres subalbatus]|uniref:uncharacterized protein LOC134202296 n=1 Tax=Armigeres subalbatus TaxID=124917 RepID=UPI002ED066FD